MNDGLIPRHDAGGGILSEYDREELERADAKLSPTARETMYQQKFHLYRNLTKPSERLYLSFAKAGASGEAQNPSYLINEIRKLFPEILVRDIEKEENPEEKLEMPRSGEALFLEELGKGGRGRDRIRCLKSFTAGMRHIRRRGFRRRRIGRLPFCAVRTV